MTNLVHGDAHGQGSSQDSLQNFRLDSPSPRINASTTTFPFYYSVLFPHLPHSSFALYYLFCHFVLVKKFPFLALILQQGDPAIGGAGHHQVAEVGGIAHPALHAERQGDLLA